MNQIEKTKINKKVADLENEVLIKALYNILDLVSNQIYCCADCESCVFGGNISSSLCSDVSELKSKTLKFISINEKNKCS